MVTIRNVPETGNSGAQTSLQCYPFYQNSNEVAAVQTDQNIQTEVSFDPAESNSDIYPRLTTLSPADLYRNCQAVITLPKKQKLIFLLPEDSVATLADNVIYMQSDETTDLSDEDFIRNHLQKELQRELDILENIVRTEEEQNAEKVTEETKEEPMSEPEKEPEPDKPEETKPKPKLEPKNPENEKAKKTEPQAPVHFGSDDVINEASPQNSIQGSIGSNQEESTSRIPTKSLLKKKFRNSSSYIYIPEDPGIEFQWKNKSVINEEVQTDLYVKPHLMDSDEEAVVSADLAAQTSVACLPEDSTSDLLPKLKLYMEHGGVELNPRGFRTDNTSVMDVIRELLNNAEKEHERMLNESSALRCSQDGVSGSYKRSIRSGKKSNAASRREEDEEVELPEVTSSPILVDVGSSTGRRRKKSSSARRSKSPMTIKSPRDASSMDECICEAREFSCESCSYTSADKIGRVDIGIGICVTGEICTCDDKDIVLEDIPGEGRELSVHKPLCPCSKNPNATCACRDPSELCQCTTDRNAECICEDRYPLPEAQTCLCMVDRYAKCICPGRPRPILKSTKSRCVCCLDRYAICTCNIKCTNVELEGKVLNCICPICECSDKEMDEGSIGPSCICEESICSCSQKSFNFDDQPLEYGSLSKHISECVCSFCLLPKENDLLGEHPPSCKCSTCGQGDKDDEEDEDEHDSECNCSKCDPTENLQNVIDDIHGSECDCEICECYKASIYEPLGVCGPTEKKPKHASDCGCEVCQCADTDIIEPERKEICTLPSEKSEPRQSLGKTSEARQSLDKTSEPKQSLDKSNELRINLAKITDQKVSLGDHPSNCNCYACLCFRTLRKTSELRVSKGSKGSRGSKAPKLSLGKSGDRRVSLDMHPLDCNCDACQCSRRNSLQPQEKLKPKIITNCDCAEKGLICRCCSCEEDTTEPPESPEPSESPEEIIGDAPPTIEKIEEPPPPTPPKRSSKKKAPCRVPPPKPIDANKACLVESIASGDDIDCTEECSIGVKKKPEPIPEEPPHAVGCTCSLCECNKEKNPCTCQSCPVLAKRGSCPCTEDDVLIPKNNYDSNSDEDDWQSARPFSRESCRSNRTSASPRSQSLPNKDMNVCFFLGYDKENLQEEIFRRITTKQDLSDLNLKIILDVPNQSSKYCKIPCGKIEKTWESDNKKSKVCSCAKDKENTNLSSLISRVICSDIVDPLSKQANKVSRQFGRKASLDVKQRRNEVSCKIEELLDPILPNEKCSDCGSTAKNIPKKNINIIQKTHPVKYQDNKPFSFNQPDGFCFRNVDNLKVEKQAMGDIRQPNLGIEIVPLTPKLTADGFTIPLKVTLNGMDINRPGSRPFSAASSPKRPSTKGSKRGSKVIEGQEGEDEEEEDDDSTKECLRDNLNKTAEVQTELALGGKIQSDSLNSLQTDDEYDTCDEAKNGSGRRSPTADESLVCDFAKKKREKKEKSIKSASDHVEVERGPSPEICICRPCDKKPPKQYYPYPVPISKKRKSKIPVPTCPTAGAKPEKCPKCQVMALRDFRLKLFGLPDCTCKKDEDDEEEESETTSEDEEEEEIDEKPRKSRKSDKSDATEGTEGKDGSDEDLCHLHQGQSEASCCRRGASTGSSSYRGKSSGKTSGKSSGKSSGKETDQEELVEVETDYRSPRSSGKSRLLEICGKNPNCRCPPGTKLPDSLSGVGCNCGTINPKITAKAKSRSDSSKRGSSDKRRGSSESKAELEDRLSSCCNSETQFLKDFSDPTVLTCLQDKKDREDEEDGELEGKPRKKSVDSGLISCLKDGSPKNKSRSGSPQKKRDSKTRPESPKKKSGGSKSQLEISPKRRESAGGVSKGDQEEDESPLCLSEEKLPSTPVNTKEKSKKQSISAQKERVGSSPRPQCSLTDRGTSCCPSSTNQASNAPKSICNKEECNCPGDCRLTNTKISKGTSVCSCSTATGGKVTQVLHKSSKKSVSIDSSKVTEVDDDSCVLPCSKPCVIASDSHQSLTCNVSTSTSIIEVPIEAPIDPCKFVPCAHCPPIDVFEIPIIKPDPVVAAMLACEAELRPIREALNTVQSKLRNLNMPELDCILGTKKHPGAPKSRGQSSMAAMGGTPQSFTFGACSTPSGLRSMVKIKDPFGPNRKIVEGNGCIITCGKPCNPVFPPVVGKMQNSPTGLKGGGIQFCTTQNLKTPFKKTFDFPIYQQPGLRSKSSLRGGGSPKESRSHTSFCSKSTYNANDFLGFVRSRVSVTKSKIQPTYDQKYNSINVLDTQPTMRSRTKFNIKRGRSPALGCRYSYPQTSYSSDRMRNLGYTSESVYDSADDRTDTDNESRPYTAKTSPSVSSHHTHCLGKKRSTSRHSCKSQGSTSQCPFLEAMKSFMAVDDQKNGFDRSHGSGLENMHIKLRVRPYNKSKKRN